MKEYQIWAEGFETKSGKTPAHLLGTSAGYNFAEACDTFFKGNSRYNAADLTHYGCKLFDDEVKARAKCG